MPFAFPGIQITAQCIISINYLQKPNNRNSYKLIANPYSWLLHTSLHSQANVCDEKVATSSYKAHLDQFYAGQTAPVSLSELFRFKLCSVTERHLSWYSTFNLFGLLASLQKQASFSRRGRQELAASHSRNSMINTAIQFFLFPCTYKYLYKQCN